MASLLRSSQAPQCLSCIRRATAGIGDAWIATSQQHVRGKKKLAKQTTIKVRLLTDVRRYGRQGSIIQITPGRMRNDFFPKRWAEYMTKAQLRELGIEHAMLERDSTFGIGKPQATTEAMPETVIETEAPIPVDLDLLLPERAMTVMSMLLPDNIDFYRTPISPAPATAQRHSPSIPSTSAISAAAQEVAPSQTTQNTSIYGSVTTADVCANLRAVLAEDDEGSRIVLSSEDISFVEEGEEKDRVKQLGVFEIDIRVKGATDSIRRTIRVNAQD